MEQKNKINLKLIDSEKDFRKIEADWDKLLIESGSDSVFLTWGWAYYWWKNFAPELKIFIILVYEQESLVGIAPFYLDNIRNLLIKYKVLRIFGDQYFISRKLGFICKEGMEHNFFSAVWDYLSINKKYWDYSYIFGLQTDSVFLKEFQLLADKKLVFYNEEKESYSWVDLTNWNIYLSRLSSRMRTKIRSLLKLFDNENEKIEFIISSSTEELDSQIDSFVNLHQTRWNRNKKAGLFAIKGSRKFFSDVAVYLLKNRRLSFFHLKYNNKYAAHQYCLIFNNVVYLINEAYDCDFKVFEAGNMLRAKVFNYLSIRGINYDFLNHFSEHKAKWGAKKCRQLVMEIGGRSLKNGFYFGYKKIRYKLKKMLINFLPESIIELKRSIHLHIIEKIKINK